MGFFPHAQRERDRFLMGLNVRMYAKLISRVFSGATCDICSRKIVRRFAMGGKQGYVCRGCDVTCHKGCHARVKDM